MKHSNDFLPETRQTLEAQMKALKAGKRKAVMLTKGEHVERPKGMNAIETKDGTLIYSPKHRQEVKKAVKANRFNEVMGYGAFSKEDIAAKAKATGEEPFAIVERTPEGTEVKAVAAIASTAKQQMEELEGLKASPENTLSVETLMKVLTGRIVDENA
jgi:DNA polymerase/3'-5' exonuclease PolX